MVARQSGGRAERTVDVVASRYPREPEVDEAQVDACDRLDWPAAPALVATGEVVGVVVAVVCAVAVVGIGSVQLLPLALALGAGPSLAARGVPVAVAELARSRAVGDAPALFGRLTLRLRVEPS